MRHRIEFEMKVYSDNAAFDEYPERELARILRDVALSVEIATDYAEGTIRDINGNKVGTFCMEVNEDDEDEDEDPRGLSRSDAGSIFDDRDELKKKNLTWFEQVNLHKTCPGSYRERALKEDQE